MAKTEIILGEVSGGAKRAKGAEAYWLANTQLTITGIGFKPSVVCIGIGNPMWTNAASDGTISETDMYYLNAGGYDPSGTVPNSLITNDDGFVFTHTIPSNQYVSILCVE